MSILLDSNLMSELISKLLNTIVGLWTADIGGDVGCLRKR